MFGPLNVFRSLPEASSTHSATAQQSPQGSSMKGLCAVVGIGTTAVLHSVLTMCWQTHKALLHYALFHSRFLFSRVFPRVYETNILVSKTRVKTQEKCKKNARKNPKRDPNARKCFYITLCAGQKRVSVAFGRVLVINLSKTQTQRIV